MLRSWIFPSSARVLSFLGILALAGCSNAEPRALREAMEMGPWTFEVESVRQERRTHPSIGRLTTVTVTLRLHNYTERFDTAFGDFMNGDTPGSMMMFPHVELEHSDGAAFMVLLYPTSGGNLRSERWRAEVDLIPHNAGIMSDSGELAARYADTSLSDLTLAIENPERRSGQPGRVVIALE